MRSISVKQIHGSSKYAVLLRVGHQEGTKYGATAIGFTEEEARDIKKKLVRCLEDF